MSVLVLGGYGATGRETAHSLRELGADVVAAGRDEAKLAELCGTTLRLDLNDVEAVRRAAAEAEVVVNCAGWEDPELVSAVTDAGAAFVEISATSRYLADLGRRTYARPVVTDVGIAPGLTNLLALDVHDGSPLDIVVQLGVGEAHGYAGRKWTYNLLGHDYPDTTGAGRTVRAYTGSRKVRLTPELGVRRAYRVDFPEQHVLTAELGVPVTSRFCLDSAASGALFSLLTRIPGSRSLVTFADRFLPASLPGSDAWSITVESRRGARIQVTGNGQSRATAAVTAQVARRLTRTETPAGLHRIHHLFTLADFPFTTHREGAVSRR
ncbi:saccharopine dehydrogenase NADP-binding domain-containing protein [Rhizohabitans arisaemae]|uniref:saccharopine dehydrogenase NADP-binding domain-containing protein n=1 Tax=Rhizohabitans arisaemae TaxID=2720610 RepID=UPI0024B16E83|nr:saccharopine dehydrogenase NADP-binding domain-containing protein [Rhizohabitans arisaemae]